MVYSVHFSYGYKHLYSSQITMSNGMKKFIPFIMLATFGALITPVRADITSRFASRYNAVLKFADGSRPSL